MHLVIADSYKQACGYIQEHGIPIKQAAIVTSENMYSLRGYRNCHLHMVCTPHSLFHRDIEHMIQENDWRIAEFYPEDREEEYF